MGILPSCSYVGTSVWLHYLDSYETLREKARCKLNKDAICWFEHILEATPNKTAAVQPLTSHFTNYPSKIN